MDELTVDDLQKLVMFYNQRTSEAELKNAQFQLVTNRLKVENASLDSKNKKLESENKTLSEKIEAAAPKSVKKSLTRED